MRYAVVAVQGSAVAQSNLAWLLERTTAFDSQARRQMCLRLLQQAAKNGLPDAWVDAGNIEYYHGRAGQRRGPQNKGMPFGWLSILQSCLCQAERHCIRFVRLLYL